MPHRGGKGNALGNFGRRRRGEFPEDFCSRAGECGHRSFTILAGALDRKKVRAEKLSYQGNFGVGYGICMYMVTGKDSDRNFLEQYKKATEDPYTALARAALEHYVKSGKRLEIPDGLPEEMVREQAGAFVSLHKGGRLRGCIGTIAPFCECIAGEIIDHAVSAGTRDPRFPPVSPEELSELEYNVDILGKPEKISSERELDVKKYGVIVTKGRKRGLLLPDLEGVESPEHQVAIAKEKAGIRQEDRDVMLERFQAVSYTHLQSGERNSIRFAIC